MIKKWVLAGIAYLLVVMIGFGIYNSVVEHEPMNMDENEEMQN